MNLDAEADHAMSKTRATKRKTAGRPPTGPSGEKVSDYPRLTVRIPLATKNQLEALSKLRRVQVWKLLDTIVLAYVEQLPNADRRLVTQFSRRMSAGE